VGVIQHVWPWYEQPQEAVEPNADIRDALRFLWSGASFRQDLITGRSATHGAATQTIVQQGRAANCSASQQNVEWSQQFLTTSDGAGGGEFTMLVVANPESGGGAVEHMLAQKNDAAGSPFAQALIGANAASNASYSAGSACFFTFNAGTAAAAAAAGVVDGEMHVWVGVRRLTTTAGISSHELWRDGVLLASSSASTRGITQSATRWMAVGSRGNGTTEAFRRQAVYAAGWDRALTQVELLAFRSPNHCHALLFAPRRIFVPVSAAPSGAPTLSDLKATNITATSVQFTYDYSF